MHVSFMLSETSMTAADGFASFGGPPFDGFFLGSLWPRIRSKGKNAQGCEPSTMWSSKAY
eukprot:12920294-Prorocentrum_lima.AAC.1